MPVSHVPLYRQTSNKSRKLRGSDTQAAPACTERCMAAKNQRNIITVSAQLTPFGT